MPCGPAGFTTELPSPPGPSAHTLGEAVGQACPRRGCNDVGGRVKAWRPHVGITAKEVPNDIDVIVAYRPDFDLKYEGLRPFEYNVVSKRAIKSAYRFDAFIFPDGSEEYLEWVDFFGKVRTDDPDQRTSRTRK